MNRRILLILRPVRERAWMIKVGGEEPARSPDTWTLHILRLARSRRLLASPA